MTMITEIVYALTTPAELWIANPAPGRGARVVELAALEML